METVLQFEIAITLFLQNLGLWLATPMKAFTFLGQEEFYLVIMPALYWCFSAIVGLRVAAILLFSNVVNTFFKLLLLSPRPYWVDNRVAAMIGESSFGLPSGHAQNASSVWGMLAFNIQRKWFTAAMVLVVLMIGLSRIYLGVHFTTDVIAGWAIGALLLIGMISFEKPALAWFQRFSTLAQIGLVFISALLMIAISLAPLAIFPDYQVPTDWEATALLAYPDEPINPLDPTGAFTVAGTWFGMAAGAAWMFSRRNGIDASGPIWKRAARYLVGIIGVLALYLGLGAIFPREADLISYSLRFVRYTLIGLWVSMFAPLLFIKLKLMEPAVAKSIKKRGRRI
jgi:membrane-associated phospholipid phosphatase